MLLNKQLLSVRHAASTDTAARPGLCGVRVEPDKNRIIATNGHMALIATAVQGGPQSDDFPVNPSLSGKPLDHAVTLPNKAVDALVKALPKKVNMPVLAHALITNGEPDRVQAHVTDLDTWNAQTIRVEEAGWPDYVEQAIPPEGKGFYSVQVDLGLLVDLYHAVSEAGGRTHLGSHPVTLTFSEDPNKAIRIDAKGDGVTITGALMPMRL